MRKFLLGSTAVALFAMSGATSALACDPDYTGVTLSATTQTGPYIASALQLAAKGWEQKTCGKVNVVEFPWSELYPKIVTSLTSGEDTFDVIAFAPAWAPDFTDYLSEMPTAMQSGADWEDIAPVYRESLMVWNGKVLSQTMDGDVHTYTYRIDLFENPDNQKAFKEKYGYDLAPAKTWKQYLDIAEFFQQPDKGVWGTAEAFRRGGQQFWFFFSHAAPYTNHPDHKGSMFFDPDTMDTQINNPGWVRGLEEYIRSSKLAPPNALNFSFGEVNAAFAGGQAAELIGWGDTGVIAADPKQSKVSGNVGSALLPGSDEIWNYKTKKWDKFDHVVQITVHGVWRLAGRSSSFFQEAGSCVGLHQISLKPRSLRPGRDHWRDGCEPLPHLAHNQNRSVVETVQRTRGEGVSRRPEGLGDGKECRSRHASAGLFLLYRNPRDRAFQGACRRSHTAAGTRQRRSPVEQADG